MSQHTPAPAESRQSYLGMWIATLLLIVAFVFGLLMFPPLFSGLEDLPPAPDHLLFWGRFHPILVHLPVGILIFVIVLEMGCLRPAFEAKYGHAALLALWLGAAGACGAVIAGILLSREGGYSGAGFQLHQTMALIGTVGVLLGLLLRLIGMASENRTLVDIYRAVLIVAFSIMGIGAHFGANITHGRTFLTEFAPEGVAQKIHSMEAWMESFVEEKPEEKPAPAPQPTPAPTPTPDQPAPPPTKAPTPPAPPPKSPESASMPAKTPSSPAAEGPLVFQAVILPLLEEKCTKCHNADKEKGDLRLDNYEVVMKGGETEGNIVPGDPDKSLSMIRLLLPEDDDEHMPPEGKPQFTDEDIALFRWWIENGASDTMTVKDQTPPPGTEARLQELMKGASARIDPSSGASRAWRMVSPAGLRRLALAAVAAAGMAATTPAAEPEAAVQQAIKAVETSGATLLPVSAEGTAYRFTALNVAKTFKDDGLKPLVPIADRIQSLDLARTQVTDAGLAAVAAMSQLKELRLDNTGITDAGLEHLKGLANLEYLNLYGSKVTDAGLQKLIGLKNLRSLYLWQTGVTKAGVAQLHGKLPGAYINIGWEESDNAQPTAVAAVAAAKPEAKPAAPAPGKPAAAVAAAAPLPATAVVFRDVVTPILADKCVSCHGPDKSKGKLKLDTYADIRKGGSDGDINVVPGKAAESLMVKRIHLPVDDDDHMPPEDKPQITAGELAVLEWWINQGASETQTLAQTKRDPKVDQAIAVVLAASKKAAPAVTKAPVKPAPAPAKPTPAPAKPAPAPAKPAAPAVASAKLDPAIAGKADVYQHIVAPILAEKCISCHGEEKGKGKLRLHTFADIMKGGGEGDVNVIPGKSGDSLMVQRILLPADDDDHMPPEDEPQTTDAELKLLRWWIDAGAPEKQALSAAKTTPEIDALIAARLKDGLPKAAASAVAEADQKPLVPPMSDAEKKALADVTMKMEALNATLMPLAQDTELLRLSVINATDKFGDKEIALLAPVAKYLVWLDLARSQVTDAGLASLAAMPNVERLHLENTKVTDAGVAKLSSLKRLGYLNLYGTKVTDKGIAPLAACAELKKLFVWQTGVTKAGAKALEGKVNGLVVNVGLSEEEIAKLTAPPPAPEKKEEAKPAPKPTAKPAAKPETKPAAKPEAKPAPQPTAKPQPKPETKPAAKPAPKPTAPPAKSNNPPPAKKQPAADTKPKAA